MTRRRRHWIPHVLVVTFCKEAVSFGWTVLCQLALGTAQYRSNNQIVCTSSVAGIRPKSSSCFFFAICSNMGTPWTRTTLDHLATPRPPVAHGASFSKASMHAGFSPWTFQILVLPWCKQMLALVFRFLRVWRVRVGAGVRGSFRH